MLRGLKAAGAGGGGVGNKQGLRNRAAHAQRMATLAVEQAEARLTGQYQPAGVVARVSLSQRFDELKTPQGPVTPGFGGLNNVRGMEI